MLWVIKVASYSPPSRSPACCGTGRHTLQITFLPVSQFPLLTFSFLPPMILLFQSSRPSRLLNISFQNPSAPSSPRASSRGEFSLKVYKYWQNTAVDTGAVLWSEIWPKTPELRTAPLRIAAREGGKGELGRGAIWESGEDVRKMWKANGRNIIQSNLPLLMYYPLSRGSDCRPD